MYRLHRSECHQFLRCLLRFTEDFQDDFEIMALDQVQCLPLVVLELVCPTI